MLRRRLAMSAVVAAAALLTCATSASPARADDNRATAQLLFQQAKELMLAGKTAEACDKFAAAADLVQTVGVRLNLATCYEKVGRTASAWTRYDEALTIAERNGDSAAAQLARSSQAALTPHLTYLSVTVSKEAAAVLQLGVLRDGQQVPKAAWGVPVPVDPGDHEIKALAPGHKGWSTSMKVVGEGTHAEVQVPVLAVEAGPPIVAIAPAPAPAAPTAAPPAAAPTKMGTQKLVGLVGGGVGVVGVIVGSIFGLMASSAWSSQQSDCGSPTSCPNHAGALADHSTLSTDSTVSTAAFIAGGVLVAGGVALFFTGKNDPATPHATGLTISPSVGMGGAGVSLGGRF